MNWTRFVQVTLKLLIATLIYLYLSKTYSKLLSVGAVFAVWFLFRTLVRATSKTLKIDYKCECGKVQGHIKLIKEDSFLLDCYCEDCRNYAIWLTKQGKNVKSILDEFGGSNLLQICKTDFSINEESRKYISLSKKDENSNFFRYYSSCCQTPIYQCLKPIGLGTVFVKTLDQSKISSLGHEACQLNFDSLSKKPKIKAEMFLPDLLEKIARYQWYSNINPFKFDGKTEFWGSK